MEKTAAAKDWIIIQRMLLSGAPPYVTAKSWVVADGHAGELLFGKDEGERREIASLTKIMTFFTSLTLAKRFHVDLYSAVATISERAALMTGTTATLEEGDQILLHDLFHGMMLPSGNDAALAVSEYFGELLKSTILPPITLDPAQQKEYLASISPRKLFVKEMNRIATELGLQETCFVNPHGLSNFYNKSSARDVAKLASLAMHDEYFRSVVKCKRHICKAHDASGKEKTFKWKNTNKLLWKGYNGVKTGITTTAGPCLATSIEKDGLSLIVVVLNCKTVDQRWIEVRKLTKWAMSRLKKLEALEDTSGSDKKKVLQMIAHV